MGKDSFFVVSCPCMAEETLLQRQDGFGCCSLCSSPVTRVKLCLRNYITVQLLLLPVRAGLDGMQENKAASDTEPFWLAARSTASVELWADVIWQVWRAAREALSQHGG